MTRNQTKIAAEILIYAHVAELDKVECDTPEEHDVIAKAIEMAEGKISRYPIVPIGTIAEIISYVKEHY
jgi:hypothetical protein